MSREQIFFETTKPLVIAFHNSLDDTNPSITPRYHTTRFTTHVSPPSIGITNPK
jgi:hypothetical protein